MPRIAVRRELPVSRDEGFDYITNVRNWRSYWPHLLDIRDEDQVVWSKPGDRAQVVVHAVGRPVEMSMTLEEFRPRELVTYESTQPDLPAFRHERHFRDLDGRLDYELVIQFQPRRGFKGLVDRFFVARAVRRAQEETLDNLERIFSGR